MRASAHTQVVFEKKAPISVKRNEQDALDFPTAWHIEVGRHGWLYFDDEGFQQLRRAMNEAHSREQERLGVCQGGAECKCLEVQVPR